MSWNCLILSLIKLTLFTFVFVETSMAGDNTPITNKSTLLNYVLNKKWSLGDFSCDSNGGSYHILTNDNFLGEELIINGQSQNSKQMAIHGFTVTGNTTFTFEQTIFSSGNKFMVEAMGDPNGVVSKVVKKYRLVTPKKLEFSGTIKMINLNTLLTRGEINYEIKNEQWFGYLCEGSQRTESQVLIGKIFKCEANQPLNDKILKDTGNESLPFKLTFKDGEVDFELGGRNFSLIYSGDFGEAKNRAGDYRSNPIFLSYYYKSNLAVVQQSGKVFTAGICKP